VSYTREGAKKWSDQCQISAFTASVCDLQRWPRAAVCVREVCARGSSVKLRVRQDRELSARARAHAHAHARKGGAQERALCPPSSPPSLSLPRYRMLIIRRRCRAISPRNEQKAEITKRPAKRTRSYRYTLSGKLANGGSASDPASEDPSSARI